MMANLGMSDDKETPIITMIYIKAYRLKGDFAGLKQAVCSCFGSTSLGVAHILLRDFCGADLGHLDYLL